MVFGGIMEAIAPIARIVRILLSVELGAFGLFAGTVSSCMTINLTVLNQYLEIVFL